MLYLVPIGVNGKNIFPVEFVESGLDDRESLIKELLVNRDNPMIFMEIDDFNFEILSPVLEYLELQYKVVVGIPEVEPLRSFLAIPDYEKVINATSIILSKDDETSKFVAKMKAQVDEEGKDIIDGDDSDGSEYE